MPSDREIKAYDITASAEDPGGSDSVTNTLTTKSTGSQPGDPELGSAIQYVKANGTPAVEVAFSEDVQNFSSNYDLYVDGEGQLSGSQIQSVSEDQGRAVIELDQSYSQPMTLQLDSGIIDSDGNALVSDDTGNTSVRFAPTSVTAGGSTNAYQGAKVSIVASASNTGVQLEGTDNDSDYFFDGSTGTNSRVFIFSTTERELGDYEASIDGEGTADITLRDLGLSVSIDDRSVTNNGTIETTVSAVAGNREIKVELTGSNGGVVNTTFATLDGAGERTLEFNTGTADAGTPLASGIYTIKVSDTSSGVTAISSEIDVIDETTNLTGNGTATDPYIITNLSEFRTIREDTTAYYELRSDIKATGTAEENDGRGFDPIESFNGTLDGNGHTITGLSIDRSNESATGVFGSVTNSGRISDVALVDADVSGSTDVGGLVGDNDGTIERAYVSGSVNGTSEVGGIAGDNGGLIEESHSTAGVTGTKRVGGLVGLNNDNSTVESSYAAGPVTGDSFVGGLIGKQRIYASSVTGSYWDTQSTGQSSSAGGTGLTTAQMTGEVARENMPAFDFNETWRVSDYYPLLRPVSAESGSLDGIRVDTPSTNVAVGSTVTTSVQVKGADVGVGAIEATLTLTNSSVGAIESVTVDGSPNQTDINYSGNNDSVSIKAYGLDLAAEDASLLIQVTLSAKTVGTTDLQISNTTIGSTEGADIPVRAESGATIRSVNLSPVGEFDQAPTDPDSDGKFEDINGDGEVTISDVQAIFVNVDDPVLQNNPELFDFSGNGEVNIVDVQRLFVEVT